jgi:type IV pilus assembly protein PilB
VFVNSTMQSTGGQAGAPTPAARRRIGDLLVDAGVLSSDAVGDVLDQRLPGERFGDVLLRIGMATEDEIADAIAEQLKLPRVNVTYLVPSPDVVNLVPSWLTDRHGILPLRVEDGVLVVATDDPSDVSVLDDIRMASGVRSVRPEVASSSALTMARRRVYHVDATQDLLDEIGEAPVDLEGEGDNGFDDAEQLGNEEGPVVRLVHRLLSDAAARRASDLHLESDADGLRVRLRIDGLLRESARVPKSLAAAVRSRLKIIANLDIAERRLPQDGRCRVKLDGQIMDLRISTMPTLDGETLVLRLLPQGAERISFEELGLSDDAREQFIEVLERPQGLVLVTGPTGSGKTSTLYAGLAEVADVTRNVLTLEDPIEYQLQGINQTQIEPAIGLTFAKGLRHVLRQDPDVLLVGEIRDAETAQLAVEAAATGHLVLATLHTNDSVASIARLVDLGVDRFLAAASIELVLAQRLLRKVCDNCAVPDEPTERVLQRLGLTEADLAGASPRRGTGCDGCGGTGELGRTAVAEVLQIDPTMKDLISGGVPEGQLARGAHDAGLMSLRENALQQAADGLVTYAEVLRATPAPAVPLHTSRARDAGVEDGIEVEDEIEARDDVEAPDEVQGEDEDEVEDAPEAPAAARTPSDDAADSAERVRRAAARVRTAVAAE